MIAILEMSQHLNTYTCIYICIVNAIPLHDNFTQRIR